MSALPRLLAACVFCGRNDGALTKEYVLPQHLARYFPDEAERADPVRRSEDGRIVDLPGAKHRFENAVRDVCGACNSGWMQQLDIAAKPIVLAIANDNERTVRAADADVLRAWTTKTALMRTLMDRAACQHARPERFREFYDHRQPFGKNFVQIARCARRAIDSNQSWQARDAGDAYCNVVSMTLGNLLFQVGIATPQDPHFYTLVGEMLRAAKIETPGRISTVRADRDTYLVGELDKRETALVQDLHFLRVDAPRSTRQMDLSEMT